MGNKNPSINKEHPLDSSYQNGQSEAEKLMRRHLQEPNHVLTDEDLKNVNIASGNIPSVSLSAEPTKAFKNSDDEGTDQIGSDRIITPLNVLGS